jgi:hypothetical protein
MGEGAMTRKELAARARAMADGQAIERIVERQDREFKATSEAWESFVVATAAGLFDGVDRTTAPRLLPAFLGQHTEVTDWRAYWLAHAPQAKRRAKKRG